MKKGIISALSFAAGLAGGAIGVGKMTGSKVNDWKQMSDKHLELFLMMNQWVKVKQEGKHLASYFEKKGYKTIAVYGMSFAGETLVNELKGSGIQILYGIDQRGGSVYTDINIVTKEDTLAAVDAVVVTAISFFEEIEEELCRKVDCPILSLGDILYQI
ncbi:MAG: hypothetical protein HFI83_01145 [Eubacterium sp.]|nr:hypothetical protein [Eubacterium sp.]